MNKHVWKHFVQVLTYFGYTFKHPEHFAALFLPFVISYFVRTGVLKEDPLEQCVSTIFGLRHPFWLKILGGTLTSVNYYFEAPLKLIID